MKPLLQPVVIRALLVVAAGVASSSPTLASPAAEKTFNLGTVYWHGSKSVTKDPKRACDLFEEAGSTGHVPAVYNLAVCYQTGSGRPQDLLVAAQLLEAPAKAGYPPAALMLATIQLYELRQTDRYGQAIEMLRALTENGSSKRGGQLARPELAKAFLILGAAHHDGLGVPASDEAAVQYFERAASLGNPLAMALLHYIYSGGREYEVAPDPDRAALWRDMFDDFRSLFGGGSIESALEYLRKKRMGV